MCSDALHVIGAFFSFSSPFGSQETIIIYLFIIYNGNFDFVLFGGVFFPASTFIETRKIYIYPCLSIFFSPLFLTQLAINLWL
ncbi:hypothetical protein QBC44DRAFT_323653 [Cladorrhinum sp. PSN332]|nr:hypothetical protein QBC44DRAFT_323653 [Cladorrhinum sp. PSN332]